MKLQLCVATSKVPNRPRNREKDNGVEDEEEYEDEIWHEPNPFPANLIQNQKVSSTISSAGRGQRPG
jgi:hypothetical protein